MNNRDLLKLCKCDECPLNNAPGPVFGHGNRTPKFAIVAEAPGGEEVKTGTPMIGPSGRLSDEMLKVAGTKRSDVYVTNTVLCRPPAPAGEGQQAPTQEAIDACSERLRAEIENLDPAVIVATGRVPTQHLTGISKAVSETTGSMNWSDKVQKFVIPTYHPSYILRSHDANAASSIIEAYERAAKLHDGVLSFPPQTVDIKWKDCRTVDEVNDALDDLFALKDTHLSLDLETEYAGDPEYEVLMAQISNGKFTWVMDAKPLLRNRATTARFIELLSLDRFTWIIHNSTFDLKHLQHHYGMMPANVEDTMALAMCLSEKAEDIGLKKLARRYMNAPYYEEDVNLSRLGPTRTTSTVTNHDDLAKYGAYDAYYTHHLFYKLRELVELQGNYHLYDQVLRNVARAFVDMEMTGVVVDIDRLREAKKQIEPLINESFNKLADYAESVGFNAGEVPSMKEAGHKPRDKAKKVKSTRLNPASVAHMRHLLYYILDLPKVYAKKNKNGTGGGLATGVEFLDANADHEVAQQLKECRRLAKVKGTYIDGVEKCVWPDGKVHADFRLFGAETGRISVTNPALQTIPNDETLHEQNKAMPSLKAFYKPAPKMLWVEADYNALELYIAYHYSKDEDIKVNLDKGDFHTPAAAAVFNRAERDITRYLRDRSKRVTYGIMYGLTEFGLSAQLAEYDEKQCKEFIENWLNRFPLFGNWRQKTIDDVLETGLLTTQMGRQRRWAHLQNRVIREAVSLRVEDVKKEAVNFPIQSLANELCLLSLVEVNNQLRERDLGDMILTVHDSLDMQIPETKLDQGLEMIHDVMTVPKFESPVDYFPIEVKIGKDWSNMEKVEL